jgi:hypothetical protein
MVHLIPIMCEVGVEMKKSIVLSFFIIGVLSVVNPLHVRAYSNNPTLAPKEMPQYFFTTRQQLTQLLISDIQAIHRNMKVQDVRVHSRQYSLASQCDQVFFTFHSNSDLFWGIGELKESRLQEGKLVARTLIQSINPQKPFEIEYAFSAWEPSLAGKINNPSLVRIDMIDGSGRTTQIYARDGFFFGVLDHGINIHEFQQVRFNARDSKNRLVASISGSELYPKHQ